jgi:hypothetical protein
MGSDRVEKTEEALATTRRGWSYLNPDRAEKKMNKILGGGMSRRRFLTRVVPAAAVTTALVAAEVKTGLGRKALGAVLELGKEGPTDAQIEGAELFIKVKKEQPENLIENLVARGDRDEDGNRIRVKARNKPWVAEYDRADPRAGDIKEKLDEGYLIPEAVIVKGNNPDKPKEQGLWALWPKDPNKITPENMRFAFVNNLSTGGQLSDVEHYPLDSVKVPPKL